MASQYESDCNRAEKVAESYGYRAISIDYIVSKTRKNYWRVTAKADNNVRVLLGIGTSSNKAISEAVEYMACK